jgi:2-polyprenyl-6-methoxyphenol hydroxylase-like FAD-dependent oxidoreductase
LKGYIMTILIAGGGIGGLTLALSLHQIGVAAKVFESVSELKPLGVGINVLPHAVRELIALGLTERLEAAAVRTKELAYFSKRGQPIWSEPRGLEAGYKWPQFSIHRGTLQQVLLDAAVERLGRENILTNHHLAGWSEAEGGIRADFIDKATGKATGSHEGTLLIAADGIHSAVREKLYPEEGSPIWNGRILWRGVTAADAFLSGRTMIMAGHEILKFVCYPISQAPDASGKHQINWVAERHMPPTYQWRREDYNRAAKLDEFLPWFEDWNFEWLDVPGLIRSCPRAYEYPLVDRDPLPRWTFGRVTLMGDAAHPMYPIGSNGSSQAILDARVLAREIRTHGATEAALQAYEAVRRPATASIVLANRKNGPEQVMQLVEERAPNGFARIEDVLSADELQDVATNYRRLAGFDKDDLNTRPPIVKA